MDWYAALHETIARHEASDPNYYRDPSEPQPPAPDLAIMGTLFEGPNQSYASIKARLEAEYYLLRPKDDIEVETFNGPIRLSAGWDQIKIENVYQAHRLLQLGYISKDEYRKYLESGRAKW